MKKTISFLNKVAIFTVIFSCKKEIVSNNGGIDIISNVYFKASGGLDNMQTFHLSRLNYSGKNFLEIIPNQDFSEVPSGAYFISDTLCYKIDPSNISKTVISELKKRKPLFASKKIEGTLFLNETIPNYRNRKNLRDTVLFSKKYKRFEINSPWTYTRFYITPNDTILPYSFYRHAEKDYGGRLERIDSYNKKEDIFVTLQLIPRKKWDNEAQEFFSFNKFLQNSKK